MRRRALLRLLVIAGLTLAAGCGPLFSPMMPILPPDALRQIDVTWENLLTPIGRTPRQTLLDALVTYYLYVGGVDRLHLVTEKFTSRGKVVMDVDCDRATPDLDQFTVTMFDVAGRTIRRERFTRADVDESSGILWQAANANAADVYASTQPAVTSVRHAVTRPMTPEQQERQREAERRLRAVQAATQPARLGE